MPFPGYVLEPNDYDLDDLIDELVTRVGSDVSGPIDLREAATRWDTGKHPRWPKGSGDRAGEFMEVGQEFMFDGHRYELSYLGSQAGGKLFAHLSEDPKHVKLREFEVGFEGGTPVLVGVSEAPAKAFVAGKGTNLTGLTVDPYVDASTHDASLKLPVVQGSKVNGESWLSFGRADQQNYIRLAEEFGKFSPGENSALVKKQMAEIDSDSKNAVASAFAAQHGSSSGTRFNFSGLIHGVTDKLKLTSAQRRREKQRRALAEVASVIQWDLYNRTQSPDVTVFHRDSEHGPGWWQQNFIDGDAPIMSGMSQSWKYSPSHLSHFGNTMLVTPLAIREICMSNYSVQPAEAMGHSEGFKGEAEIATADQLMIDSRSVVISENQQLGSAGMKQWLAGLCQKPSGGAVARELADYIKSGKIPPLPPAPPKVVMDGSGGKTYVDPPHDVGKAIEQDAKGTPLKEPIPVSQVGYAQLDAAGEPIAAPANQLPLQPGSLIEGMQGARYVILSDPANPTFPFVRAEIDSAGNWAGQGKTFPFSEGGSKTFKLLDGFAVLPKLKAAEEEGPLWDPAAWANGTDEEFTPKLPEGAIFKVNDQPYKVIGPAGNGNVKIQSLESGKFGVINPDYKATPMVPKEGYIAPSLLQTKPEPGVTFAFQGEKYQVTVLLKNGLVQAKRVGAAGVIKLQPDDPVLAASNLHDPSAYDFGQEEQLGELKAGERFHGGTGVLTQKPYVVMGEGQGGKVLVRSLDTGDLSELPAKKKFKLLVPKAEQEPGGEENPGGHLPRNWKVGAPATLGALKQEEKFVFAIGDPDDRQPLIEIHGEVVAGAGELDDVKQMQVRLLTGAHAGELHTVAADTPAFRLEPHEATDGPVAPYNPGAYLAGPTKRVANIAVGEVFLGGKNGDVPYVMKKQGPASGAVATNLLTGKPYPAISYEKEFATAVPKNGTKVPYAKLMQGDPVAVSELQTGDQFGGGGLPIWQVEFAASGEDAAVVREVTPWGLGSTQAVSGPLLVDFYAKYGAGYDPAKAEVPVPLDASSLSSADPIGPGNPDMPDAQVEGLLSTFTASDLHKAGHLSIEQMAVGSVGFDQNGKAWIVKQAGASAIVSDGQTNYETWGSLILRLPEGEGEGAFAFTLSSIDQAPPIGMQGTDAAVAQGKHNLVPNAAAVTLGEMQYGDWFSDVDGKHWQMAGLSDSGDMASVIDVKGEHKQFWSDYMPVMVAEIGAKGPKDPRWDEDAWAPELKTTLLEELKVGDKAYWEEQPLEIVTTGAAVTGTNLQSGASVLLTTDHPYAVKMFPKEKPPEVELKVGDQVLPSQLKAGMVFGATQGSAGSAQPIEVLAATDQGTGDYLLKLKYQDTETAVGVSAFDMSFSDEFVKESGTTWVLTKVPGEAPAVAAIDAGQFANWETDLVQGPGLYAEELKVDMVVQPFADKKPFLVAFEGGSPMLVGEDGKKTSVIDGKLYQQLVPKGDPAATGKDAKGFYVYAVGDRVTKTGIGDDKVWTVTGFASDGAIVKLVDKSGETTAIGRGLTKPYVPPASPVVQSAGDALLGDQVGFHYGEWDLTGKVVGTDGKQLSVELNGDVPEGFEAGQSFGLPKTWELSSLEKPPSSEVTTKFGTFKEGDTVAVWPDSWDEPKKATFVKVTTPGQETEIQVVYEGESMTSYALAEWLRKPGSALPHTGVQVGQYVTYSKPGQAGKVMGGEVVDWDPKTDSGHVKLQHTGAVVGISAENLLDSTGDAKPEPLPVGSPVVGSQLSEGDYIKVAGGTGLHLLVTKAESAPGGKHLIEFEVVGQPIAGKPIGAKFGGEWADNTTKTGKWVAAAAPAAPVAPVDEHGFTAVGFIQDGDHFKSGPLDPVVWKVLYTEGGTGDVYAESAETGNQKVFPGDAKVVPVAAGDVPPSPYKDPPPVLPSVPQGVIPPLPNQAQLDHTIAKYGGVDAIPASPEKGFGSEWGSGGAYRYRPLSWLPNGATVHLKGSSTPWLRIAELAEGVVIVNQATGDALRVMSPAAFRVKPPAGKSWKQDPDS